MTESFRAWKATGTPADTPPVAVTTSTARRKVNAFVAAHIGNLLLAGEPKLVWIDRLLWRVPIDLTHPRVGRIGCVGQIDIGAMNGEIVLTESEIEVTIDTFRANAQRLHSDPAL